MKTTGLAVSGVALGLLMVRVPTEVPPTIMLVGASAKLTVCGSRAVTVRVALLASVLLPVEAVNPPTGKVKTKLPAVALLTFTLTVQVPPGARARPLAVIEVLPAAAVTVPPQVLTIPGVVAVTTPTG